MRPIKLLSIVFSLILLVFLIMTFFTSNTKENQVVKNTFHNLSSLIKKTLENKEFSGVVLVAIKDQIVFHEPFGFANQEKKIKNAVDTRFLIGSITKLFIAASVLRLQEIGKIDLTKPISYYLKPTDSIFGDVFPDFADQVSVQDLLTHSSGIEDYTKLKSFAKFNLDIHTRDELVQFFSDYPLKFVHGSQYDYSASNYTLLGSIIETISGEKIEDFLNSEFFHPLKMNSTYIPKMDFLNVILENDKKLSTGYIEERKSNTTKLLTAIEDINLSTRFSDASAISTTNDLYTFSKALFQEKILSQEQLSEMTTPYFETQERGIFAGYGLFLTKDPSFGPLYIIPGQIDGYESILSYEPQNEITIILLSNVMNDQTSKIAKEITTAIHSFSHF